MQPINYMTDVQTPFAAALQGYQGGMAIRNDQAQQQQQQAAQAQQQKLQGLLARASAPGASADDFTAVMVADPKNAEAYTKAWTAKNTAQQQSLASDLLQWGAAIKSGKPDFAAEQMTQRADAMERSGAPPQEVQAMRTQAQILKEHPQFALGQIQALLAVNPNGKDAAETLAKFGAEKRAADKAPIELRTAEAGAQTAEAAAAVAPAVQAATRDKAVADAETARVTAKYADSQAVLDLQKKGWDIKALEADVAFKRETARIAAMNVALAQKKDAREAEDLKLRRDEAIKKRDDAVREKVATAEAGASSVDNMLNTIERIKKNASLGDVLGSFEGRLPAVVTSGLDDEEADAIALIETLGSQAFLAQIPNIKGMGALSNAEGDKLQSALQNLGRAQSEKQFRANLDEAARLLKKGRESISRSTGVPLSKPDTPAAPGARPPLDSFFK